MNLHRISLAALAAASPWLLAAPGAAQIERLDLAQMVERTDGAVFGTILGREVFRVDHPVDGPELYFTTLLVEGRSLVNGEPATVAVTYAGGFVDAENGVWNSEAPTEDEVRTGSSVVVFYKWTDNMGGDVAANALYGSHGGLYTSFEARGRRIVQGRGEGYAIEQNVQIESLGQRIARLREARGK